MKMKIFGKLMLGIALGAAFSAASLSSLIRMPKQTNAGVVSSSAGQSAPAIGTYLTAGKLVYLNINSSGDAWANKKYAFRFVDNTAEKNAFFSDWAVHAKDGDRFYCAEVPVNEASSTAQWASISAVCYATTATSPNGDYDVATTIANGSKTLAYITSQTTGNNEFSLTAGSIASGTSAAKELTTGFAFQTWASSSEGFDYCSVWSQDFVDETDIPCNIVGQSDFQKYLNYYWSANATTYNALSTSAKTVFTTTQATGDKYTNINAALARYKRIYYLYYGKTDYTITNFAGLTGLTTSSGLYETSEITENSESEAALVISGTVALLAAGAFVLIKHKLKIA